MNENVEIGNVVLQFLKSKDNFADMFTKAVGPNIYLGHYDFVMGGRPIPRVLEMVKTTDQDTLPCPLCCLGLLGKDYQL